MQQIGDTLRYIDRVLAAAQLVTMRGKLTMLEIDVLKAQLLARRLNTPSKELTVALDLIYSALVEVKKLAKTAYKELS